MSEKNVIVHAEKIALSAKNGTRINVDDGKVTITGANVTEISGELSAAGGNLKVSK